MLPGTLRNSRALIRRLSVSRINFFQRSRSKMHRTGLHNRGLETISEGTFGCFAFVDFVDMRFCSASYYNPAHTVPLSGPP